MSSFLTLVVRKLSSKTVGNITDNLIELFRVTLYTSPLNYIPSFFEKLLFGMQSLEIFFSISISHFILYSGTPNTRNPDWHASYRPQGFGSQSLGINPALKLSMFVSLTQFHLLQLYYILWAELPYGVLHSQIVVKYVSI